MMDDFKPQKPDQFDKPANGSDGAQQSYQSNPETYETTTQEPVRTDETVAAAPVVATKKKSGAKKWLLGGLTVLLLAGLGAFAYWQWSEAESAKKELSSIEAALQNAQDIAKSDSGTTEPDESISSTAEDFDAFMDEYGKMAAVSAVLTDADEKAIETAIKDYYKLTTLPEGWQIVIAYKDAKADRTTGKPVNALIFWPASESKPAGFFEVSQTQDGSWKYNEQR